MCRGVRYIEGRTQWNGREDEKSMIVSHARFIRIPGGGMAGLLKQQQQ